MENAKTRKAALRIESALLNKIALMGLEKVSKAVGVDKAQISRWKRDWIPKLSMLLAVLEWGVEDEEMAELTRRLVGFLQKEKAPKNGEFFEA